MTTTGRRNTQQQMPAAAKRAPHPSSLSMCLDVFPSSCCWLTTSSCPAAAKQRRRKTPVPSFPFHRVPAAASLFMQQKPRQLHSINIRIFRVPHILVSHRHVYHGCPFRIQSAHALGEQVARTPAAGAAARGQQRGLSDILTIHHHTQISRARR